MNASILTDANPPKRGRGRPRGSKKKPSPELVRLLPDALYSWNDIQPFVRLSRETWRKRVISGDAPKPVPMGSTHATRYRGSDILTWISSPATYRAEG
jgi:predicted DNA-binding transcriptional regulator AlpA